MYPELNQGWEVVLRGDEEGDDDNSNSNPEPVFEPPPKPKPESNIGPNGEVVLPQVFISLIKSRIIIGLYLRRIFLGFEFLVLKWKIIFSIIFNVENYFFYKKCYKIVLIKIEDHH